LKRGEQAGQRLAGFVPAGRKADPALKLAAPANQAIATRFQRGEKPIRH
jgi:hypothetical protein